MRGVLITFEGVEGSGKTTQLGRLARALAAEGYRVERTSEPDGTALGLGVRRLFERRDVRFQPLTEMFLFLAARSEWSASAPQPELLEHSVGGLGRRLPHPLTCTATIAELERTLAAHPGAPLVPVVDYDVVPLAVMLAIAAALAAGGAVGLRRRDLRTS